MSLENLHRARRNGSRNDPETHSLRLKDFIINTLGILALLAFTAACFWNLSNG